MTIETFFSDGQTLPLNLLAIPGRKLLIVKINFENGGTAVAVLGLTMRDETLRDQNQKPHRRKPGIYPGSRFDLWGRGETGRRVSLGNFRSHDHAGSSPVVPTKL